MDNGVGSACRRSRLASLFFGLAWLLPAPAAAETIGAEGIVIGDYALVSSQRITRTLYEYTYRANASNWSSGDATVAATLVGTAAHTTIVEGSLSFDDVAEGATEQSTDTFKIRHQRTHRFDPVALVWAAEATPLPPTSFDLIDAALSAGDIDAETALVYSVFEEFDDPRLPGPYRGRDDGFFETRATQEARRLFDTLSPDTQQILAPFLSVPDLAAAPGASSSAMTSSAPTAHDAVQPLGGATPAHFGQIEAVPGVVLAWDADDLLSEALEQQAMRLAPEISNTIWPKLVGLLGAPAAGRRVVIFLQAETGRSEETTADCVTATIQLYNESAIAHELTHALLDLRYPGQCNAQDTLWLHEATATWAEHFVYPTQQREHRVAPDFLRRPEVELERHEGRTGFHQYGAYLWFLYITQGSDPGAHFVRETWDAVAGNGSLGAIDKAIETIGGLREQWPKFVLYNWNREQRVVLGVSGDQGGPYRFYSKWDKLPHVAKQMTREPKQLRLNGKTAATESLAHDIDHLAARYFPYDFTRDPSIRSLTFSHPYADGHKPAAKVQAILKIRDQGWKPAQDWTGDARKHLCLDVPAEDVEQLVIVISNSDFVDRSALSNTAELEISALGCNPFVGTVRYEHTLDITNGSGFERITETAETSVTLERDESLLPGFDNAILYQATHGTVTWQHQGSSGGPPDCSGAGSGVAPLPVDQEPDLGLIRAFPPPLGDGSTYFYSGTGSVPTPASMSITWTCVYPDGQQYTVEREFSNGSFWRWWDSLDIDPFNPPANNAATLDPDGSFVLRGNHTRQDFPGDVEQWTWDLKQVQRPRPR